MVIFDYHSNETAAPLFSHSVPIYDLPLLTYFWKSKIRFEKIIEQARKVYVTNVNTIMLKAYWNIGKRIVEEEQQGKLKAKYGSRLLKEISKELTKEFGRSFSKSNLFSMRKFYAEYQKFQTVSGKLCLSHYLLLLQISDRNERAFYEHECENSNWSVRTLERQIDSALYQRLLLLKGEVNKEIILELAEKGITFNTPDSFIKDPIGVILCADKEQLIAELSIQGLQNNIYAAKYTTVMPDIEVLQNEVKKVIERFNEKE